MRIFSRCTVGIIQVTWYLEERESVIFFQGSTGFLGQKPFLVYD